MTTIIGKNAYGVIVLGTDLQASYEKPIQHKDGIFFQKNKQYTQKLITTPDEKIIMALTGAMTPEAQAFIGKVCGKNTGIPDFNLIDDLNKGYCEIFQKLNLKSMGQKSLNYDVGSCFHLAIVYQPEMKMWHLGETGFAMETNEIFIGSGGVHAKQAHDVLKTIGYSRYNSSQAKLIELVGRSVEYASRIDRGSSGIELLYVTNEGIRNLTEETNKKDKYNWKKSEHKIIKSIDSLFSQ